MHSEQEHRTLAIYPGALGDVILFGHLLAALGRRVTLVAGGEKGDLLAGAGVVGAALDFDSLPMHEVFADTALEECRLPKLIGRHDRLVSCFAGGDERLALGRDLRNAARPDHRSSVGDDAVGAECVAAVLHFDDGPLSTGEVRQRQHSPRGGDIVLDCPSSFCSNGGVTWRGGVWADAAGCFPRYDIPT